MSEDMKKFETAAEADAFYRKMEADKKAGVTLPPAKSAEDLAKEEKMLPGYPGSTIKPRLPPRSLPHTSSLPRKPSAIFH